MVGVSWWNRDYLYNEECHGEIGMPITPSENNFFATEHFNHFCTGGALVWVYVKLCIGKF